MPRLSLSLNITTALQSVLFNNPYIVLGFNPELVFDFQQEYYRTSGSDTTFESALTTTRASNATMVDSSGTLVTVGVNVPRRGHHIWNGSAWVDEGYFHESEARTNELLDSGDVFESNWTGTASGLWGTYEEVLSYFGTTAYRLLGDGVTSSLNRVTGSGKTGTFSGGSETASCWVEGGTGEVQLGVYDSTDGAFVYRARLVWSSGVVSDVTGTGSVVLDDLGTGPNGGQLYRIAATCNGTVGNTRRFYLYPGGTSATTNGCIVHGAQLEAGSTPSSYIPTAGATVTRAADAMTISAANLPWPEPVVIGPELVTNGTFDTDTDWTLSAGWTITDGKLEGDATGGVVENVVQTLATVVGNVYNLTFDVDTVSGNDVLLNVGSSSLGTQAILTTGSKSFFFVSSADNEILQFRFSGASTAGDTITIDNISVSEINPLAVSIQMEGTMTYADEGEKASAVGFVNWLFTGSNYIQDRIDTSGSGSSGTFTTIQSASGVIDFKQKISAYSPGINVPFNIASRHGSTFINGAVDGTALTADLTPTALPYLENTDMEIGSTFNGTIKLFRVWADDLTDVGIAEASA